MGIVYLKTCAATLVVLGLLLAGCSGEPATIIQDERSRPAIEDGKGAITGLVIDDRYRPVPDALVLLTPVGLTINTDSEGQFSFGNLLPGAYVLQVTADAHEAAPKTIDVVTGQYTEIELEARRVFSAGGYTITTQYSVFAPCMTSVVFVTLDHSYCMPDSSGDTFRPGIDVDLRAHKKNITYLVSEIKLNQVDNYVFVVRCSGGGSFGCGEYGYVNMTDTDYGRVVMKYNSNYMLTPHSVNWTNKDPIDGLLFYYGVGGPEITTVGRPVGCLLPPVTNPLNGKPLLCRDFYGAGNVFGVKAKIVMTAFLGPPEAGIDVATYNVLGGP